MPTEAELREHKLKVMAATAEGIQRDLDSLLMGAYNLYDVGRAIPHPYDAIGGMASKFLHDFRGTASSIQTYIELAKSELESLTETVQTLPEYAAEDVALVQAIGEKSQEKKS